MVKEANNTSHPKAINIIRPTHSFSVRRSTQIAPSSSTIIANNKPKVARSAKINVEDSHYTSKKTQLNIYHPPSRRLQSQKPTIPYDAQQRRQQQQQQQRRLQSSVITATTTSIVTENSKPSFEVYKPAIKHPLPRSRTTPVVPSATLSTPISNTDNFYPHPQQQQRKKSISQITSTISTQSSSPLTRSVTHHSLATSATSSSYIDNNDTSSSSDDNAENECSEMNFSKHRGLSRSDTGIHVRDTIASEAKKDKNTSSDYEDQEGDEDDSVINEARVNRKIADLEISNRSLLAVNEMLEMTVRRQALQMTQLKQQIAQDGATEIKPPVSPIEQHEVDSDEEWEKNNTFHRMCQMTEKMIKLGEASLKYECKRLGGRVISHYKQTEEEDNNSNDDEEKEHKESVCEDDGDALLINVQDMKLGEEFLIKNMVD